MSLRVGRRAVLAGAAAWLAAPGLRLAAATPPALSDILGAKGLGGLCGFAVADLDSGGTLLEGHEAEVGRTPASVAKIVTALYALETLGTAHRFRTRALATGPVEDGALRGDLVLAGGGDPVLDTDALNRLVDSLKNAGVGRVDGRLLVADGALPTVADVAPDQPEDAGYNPTISGINLNFNRVELRWTPGSAPTFGAPGRNLVVPVTSIGATVGPGPIRHRFQAGRELWSLPEGRVRGTGSDWLPVRAPAAYTGEVFAGLAARAGIAVPSPEVVRDADGVELAAVESPELGRLMRDMLRFSTNLTAEATGLAASGAGDLPSSAAAMTAWARDRYGLAAAGFVDHSGLGDGSKVPPEELLAVLAGAREAGLPELLRTRPVLDAKGNAVDLGVEVVAKTGTLYFASGLAGYMIGKRTLAFAILAVDPELRAQIRPEERAGPPGAKAWANRARAQQQALLRRWATLYAT